MTVSSQLAHGSFGGVVAPLTDAPSFEEGTPYTGPTGPTQMGEAGAERLR